MGKDPMMKMDFAAKTDIGLVRKNNEDACFTDEKSGLFMVADGMGGANAGEVASRMAIDIISGEFASTRHLIPCILRANREIFEAGRRTAGYSGMGTTVVACSVEKDSYTIAWVGDSRLYLIRHGRIRQLTADHSMVQELVDKGLVSPEDAVNASYKNILTRVLGVGETVEPGSLDIPTGNDDFLVLCSDGLTGMISDARIRDIIVSLSKPARICDELIAQANAAGGIDNCTAVVIHIVMPVHIEKNDQKT